MKIKCIFVLKGANSKEVRQILVEKKIKMYSFFHNLSSSYSLDFGNLIYSNQHDHVEWHLTTTATTNNTTQSLIKALHVLVGWLVGSSAVLCLHTLWGKTCYLDYL